MQLLRDMLRESLAAALHAHPPLDRVTAAWPVVCGAAIAQRTRILSLENGALEVAVPDGAWLRQMESLREKLLRELPPACAQPLTAILFKVRPAEFAAQIGRQNEQH